jgi:hypothetical protein
LLGGIVPPKGLERDHPIPLKIGVHRQHIKVCRSIEFPCESGVGLKKRHVFNELFMKLVILYQVFGVDNV